MKKTTNTNQESQKARSPRAVRVLSRTAALRLLVKSVESHMAEALDVTKNGTLKISGAAPDVKEDIKGTIKVDGKTFYLVPAAPTTKGIFSALISFCDIVEARRALADKIAKTQDFESWVKTADAQRQITAAISAADLQRAAVLKAVAGKVDAATLKAIDAATPKPDADKISRELYEKYLNGRGLTVEDVK